MHIREKKYMIWGWGKIVILALLFTVLIRFFLLESYYISSSWMETAVLKGDYLLVNKIPPDKHPKRNAIMLFKSPLQKDTIKNILFLSRCIGIPGDTLFVSEKELSINGKETPKSPHLLSRYTLSESIQQSIFFQMKRLNIPVRDVKYSDSTCTISLTSFEEYQLKDELPDVTKMHFNPIPTEKYTLTVPRKGMAYRLDSNALTACKEIIMAETNGEAVFRNGKLYLDGRETSFFFFKHNYYWMLSDNTTEGIDSRHLGFIPDDHLVGNALIIWMSKVPQTNILNGYRWNRIFNILN